MKFKRPFFSLIIVLLLLSALSCQRYKTRNQIVNEKDTYFSIKQYAADQVQMFAGAPHSLYKITHLNGGVDTTIANFMNLDWSPILKAFSETDISDRKFVGQYDFAMYDDETTGSRGLIYTAKTNKSLTRVLQINTDPSNNRITSIYIETAKHDFFGSTRRKLLYVPLRIIQIQEAQNNLIGNARSLRVDYRFMGEDESEI